MTSRIRYTFFATVFLLTAGWFWFGSMTVRAAPVGDSKAAAAPVESDMHEFMEYVFQPTFKRLRPLMGAAPVDNQAWKSIKADSLILAEGGNLLLIRQPEDDATDWVKHSVQVRDFGGQLYRAAKAKDYPSARRSYESMVTNCNACHQQFAGGEHILTP